MRDGHQLMYDFVTRQINFNSIQFNSKAQKRQVRYYNASRHELRYNLGDKVWKRNCVLLSASQGVAAKLAPKFAGPYTIAGKVHVEDLKPFHEKTASEENSEDKQADSSPSEISEECNASPTSHSANAEGPEAETHPRPRGRPRKARLVVKRTAQILGRRANKRTLVETPTQPSTSNAAAPLPRLRGRPAGSKNTATTTRMTAHSPRRTRSMTRRACN